MGDDNKLHLTADVGICYHTDNAEFGLVVGHKRLPIFIGPDAELLFNDLAFQLEKNGLLGEQISECDLPKDLKGYWLKGAK